MSGGNLEILLPVFVVMTPMDELVNVDGRLVRRWRGILTPSGAAVDVYTVGIGTDDPAGQEVLKQVFRETDKPDWLK